MQDLLIDQRELIIKILARYTTKYSVFRELVQNSDDAGSSEIIIEINENTVVFKNNGKIFGDEDWTRIRTVAKGNPEEDTVGCFGVGFYSVFSITEEPIIISGNKCIQFVFIDDQLKIKSSNTKNIDEWTKFIFTDVSDSSIFEYDNLKVYFTEVLKYTTNIGKVCFYVNGDLYSSSRKEMVKQLGIIANDEHVPNVIDLKLRAVDIYRMVLYENDMSICYILVDSSFSVQFDPEYVTEIKALLTKKLPKKTNIKLLYPDKPVGFMDNIDCTKPINDLLPGYIYIGYKTYQTTGYGFDINAQFIPTVERESIDLNSRIISNWNITLLNYSGIVSRIYYQQCMARCFQDMRLITSIYSYQKTIPNELIGSVINNIFIDNYDSGIFTNSGIVNTKDVLVDNRFCLSKLDNLNSLVTIPIIDIDQFKRVDSKSLYEQLFSVQKYTKIPLDGLINNICSNSKDTNDTVSILKWSFELKCFFNKKLLLSNLYFGDKSIGYYKYFSFEKYSPSPPTTIPEDIMSNFTENELTNNLSLEKLTFKEWFNYIIDTFSEINRPDIIEFINRKFYNSDIDLQNYILDRLKGTRCIPMDYLNIKECSYPHECYIKLCDEFQEIKYIDTKIVNISSEFFTKLGCKLTITIDDIIKYSKAADLEELFEVIFRYHSGIDKTYFDKFYNVTVYNKSYNGSYIKASLSHLFFPNQELERIGFPTIVWRKTLDKTDKEYLLLQELGVRTHPTIEDLMNYINNKTDETVTYIIKHFIYYSGLVGEFEKYAFIPTDKGLCHINNCFQLANPFKYPIIITKYNDLLKYFPIQPNPPIKDILVWIDNKLSTLDKQYEIEIYKYLYNRISDITEDDFEQFRFILRFNIDNVIHRPDKVFIENNENKNIYRGLLYYIDYETKANLFLGLCGVKTKPNAQDICDSLIQNHIRYFNSISIHNGCEIENAKPYITILEYIFNNISDISGESIIKLKQESIFVSYINTIDNNKEVLLTTIDKIFLIDDCYFGEYFNPPSCPYIKNLEQFYEYLGSRWISSVVMEKSSPKTQICENDISEQVRQNISIKAQLIITDKQGRDRLNIIDRDEMLEYLQNIRVMYCESIDRTLYFLNKEYTDSFASACMHDNTLYISPHNEEIDYYDIGYCICKRIMSNNQILQEDYSDITMVLVRSLDILKMKGYLVDKLYDSINPIEEILQETSQKESIIETTNYELEQPDNTIKDTDDIEYVKNTDTESYNMIEDVDTDELLNITDKKISKEEEVLNNIETSFNVNYVDDNEETFYNIENIVTDDERVQSGSNEIPLYENGIIEDICNTTKPICYLDDDTNIPIQPEEPYKVDSTDDEINTVIRQDQSIQQPDSFHFNHLIEQLDQQIEEIKCKSQICTQNSIDPSISESLPEISESCSIIDIEQLTQIPISGTDFKIFIENGILSTELNDLFLDFSKIISFLLEDIFHLPKNIVNIFYDKRSTVIGFNSDNKLFLNARCHHEINYGTVSPIKYWFIVICHELAHNEVKLHNAAFSSVFENIILYYLNTLITSF